MYSDRVFQVTLLISLITHGFILLQNPNLAIFPKDKNEQKLQVSYVKELRENKGSLKTRRPSLKEPSLKLPPRVTANTRTPPPFLEKESIFKKTKESASLDAVFTKPLLMKPGLAAVKKKITLPPLDLHKLNNPSYVNYYQIVREKIRRAAYQNYTRQETGEVFISFIVSCDGYLKESQLIEEKSSVQPYLRETALRSLKDASPFPVFPKELDYPSLSFNVVISFEVE